jgi:diaminohydroxyphosphoribosylaminopyrimidine deaminase/5-amino-6-(5-phosphoribosylamino)uracil reductase
MLDINEAYARCAALSAAHLGRTAPNPNVSAVIYSADGTFIAEGAHDRRTSPDHAEVVAIKKAGEQARDATIVVSLEPCNHIGSTGPCVDAIINAGIARVIYAVKDPNPVAAGGAERLKTAGVVVELAESAQLVEVQGAWLHRIRTGRPYFIWKVATTLDGRIAAVDNTSQWISSEASRDDVQILRNQSDAILIGTGTALADNPTLAPRVENANSPIRIVMGTRDIPADAKLNNSEGQTVYLKTRSVDELLKAVDYLPLNQVLVEAGPQLGSALFAAGVIDEVVIYQAPKVLGSGRTWMEEIGVATIKDAATLTLLSVEQIDSDVKFRYRVEKR